MQTMGIEKLLKNTEGKTLEFKQNLSSPIGVLRTIVAFANTAGGTIILGVEDKSKKVCGVENPLEIEEKLANLIADCISPQIIPEVEVVLWRNSYLLTIEIFPSSVKPHYLKKQGVDKGTYIRVGSTNRLVDNIMLSELQRVRIDDSFDKQAMTELNSEEIDFRVASELFEPVKKLNKQDLLSMNITTKYQNKQVPTIGGEILFGRDRLQYFPDAWIQVGRFKGATKTNIFDTQDIVSYPILAIDSVMDFVQKHAMQTIEINEVRNTKIWNVPMVAIREALINAVVHTDYSQQGSPIRISIFDDRIEIENPGLLMFGLTVDDIKCGLSKLRNRVLGQIFYRLGLIERWGSGIRRIIDSCVEAGFQEPQFEEIGTHFRVTIFTEIVSKPLLDEIDQKIITLLKKTNGLTTKEVADKIKKSQRTARTRLLGLIEKGFVVELAKNINDPGRKYFYKDNV